MAIHTRLGASGLAVTLVSPFDVWCAGIEQFVLTRGWDFSGRWPGLEGSAAQNALRQAMQTGDVLLIANRLIDRAVHSDRYRSAGGRFGGGVVAVIEPGDPFTMRDFLALDVAGIVLSTTGFDDLGHCIESVAGGGRWIDPGLRELLGSDRRGAGLHAELSDRELQVARLAASGLSNKVIARNLGVSEGTVKMHMHHVLGKLQVDSRFNLRQLGWLDPGQHVPVRLADAVRASPQVFEIKNLQNEDIYPGYRSTALPDAL